MQGKIEWPCFGAGAERFHRRNFRRVVGNLFTDLIQHSGNMVGQIIGKPLVHHNGPTAEIDDSCRIVDPGNPAMIHSRPLKTVALQLLQDFFRVR